MKASIEREGALPAPLAEVIATHRFFKGMRPEHHQKLAEAAMFKRFVADELICVEGEPANRFYLIYSGKVALENQGANQGVALPQMVGEGEELGWSWLFPPHYWQSDARAVEATTTIFFYGTRLRAQCEEDPVFGYELMKRIAAVVVSALEAARAQLLDLQQKAGQKIQ